MVRQRNPHFATLWPPVKSYIRRFIAVR